LRGKPQLRALLLGEGRLWRLGRREGEKVTRHGHGR